MYEYPVRITNVVDGDTIDAVIDLGCHVSIKERLRLSGINSPEPRGVTAAAGHAATDHLVQLIDDAQDLGPLFIRTEKDSQGKYGRYLATLFSHHGQNLNDQMIADGHAVPY
jgi:micrococcal nuclease